jgi:hypothetical protein
MFSIGVTIGVAWFGADLITGVIHWLEDRYLDGASGVLFLDVLAEDNERHHVWRRLESLFIKFGFKTVEA